MSNIKDIHRRGTLAEGVMPDDLSPVATEDPTATPTKIRYLTTKEFLRDATALHILWCYGIVITDLPKDGGGRDKKWIGAYGKQLVEEVEAAKAEHKVNAGCGCGSEKYCRRCKLSDMAALKKMVDSHPTLLERFLKPPDLKKILNRQGKIKAGVDLDPIWTSLKSRLSEARKAHGKR